VAIALIVAVSIALMLIRPREIAEVWWVGAGALLLVLARLVPLSLAVHAVGEGADVYFFLLGMMLLSQLASEHGVFDWLSGWTIRSARGSSARLFTLVYGAGTVVTIFLSNDATAVVLTPAILAAVKRAEVAPRPHLFVCAFIANAASFVLPISNPANLVVFQHGMPSLGRWLASFALPSLLSITATYGALRLYFRSELRGELGGRSKDEPLPTGGRWVVGGLALVVVVLLVASAFNVELGLPTLAVAGVVTAAVSLRTRLLVAALFVLVDAVESVGALALARGLLARASSLPAVPGALLTAAVVAVANNLVNNLPLGLIAGATIHAASPSALLTHSILVGIDLGPNLSITGSLATILWLLALRKGKVQVGFLDFFKVGAIAMPAALIASIAGLLLLHAFGLP
jgi:arsenical pump membrane protein